jgi:hypothetical protein
MSAQLCATSLEAFAREPQFLGSLIVLSIAKTNRMIADFRFQICRNSSFLTELLGLLSALLGSVKNACPKCTELRLSGCSPHGRRKAFGRGKAEPRFVCRIYVSQSALVPPDTFE